MVSDVWGLALGLVTVVLGVAAFGSFSVPPSLDLFPPISAPDGGRARRERR